MKVETNFQPSCSEASFKVMDNTVVEVALAMLDVIQGDYNDKKEKCYKSCQERYKKAKKWLQDNKEYDKSIHIGWSCNYDTYIYNDGSGDIKVNTCNNHIWNDMDINMFPGNGEEGYNIPKSEIFMDLATFKEFRYGDKKESWEE